MSHAPLFLIDALHTGNEVFLLGDVHLQYDGPQVFEVSHVLDAARCCIDGVARLQQRLHRRLAYACRGAGHQRGLAVSKWSFWQLLRLICSVVGYG